MAVKYNRHAEIPWNWDGQPITHSKLTALPPGVSIVQPDPWLAYARLAPVVMEAYTFARCGSGKETVLNSLERAAQIIEEMGSFVLSTEERDGE